MQTILSVVPEPQSIAMMAIGPFLVVGSRRLVTLIHGLGWTALAEGVDDGRDLAALWALGFDGATGRAVVA